MMAKFHGNILNLGENIAKCFRGATFFDSHCRYTVQSLTADIKSLRDNVKLVANQLSVTQETFRRQLNSFIKVCQRPSVCLSVCL